ncbi:hypothetical protein VB779_15655 [Haloarculaceae archaeon H-GB11]|nr:hypothetical protein [Haloarculaceae archaeon H-GB11]
MTADPDVPWGLVSEVRRSRRKTQIIEILSEEPAAATDVASEIRLETKTVSNYFLELKTTEPPLIKCLTPEQPHHRLYCLTETGDVVSNHIGSNN